MEELTCLLYKLVVVSLASAEQHKPASHSQLQGERAQRGGLRAKNNNGNTAFLVHAPSLHARTCVDAVVEVPGKAPLSTVRLRDINATSTKPHYRKMKERQCGLHPIYPLGVESQR